MSGLNHTVNEPVKMYVSIGTQPVVRALNNGKCMTTFFAMTINPTPEQFRPNGNIWFRVICWDELAETAGRELHKGKKVLLVGNVITQGFKNRKGQIKHKEVVVATNIILLNQGSNEHTPLA